MILEAIVALQRGGEPQVDPLFMDSVRKVVKDCRGDKSLLGMALGLPAETYLAQQMDVIDPDNLHHARAFVQMEIGEQLRVELREVWQENNDPGGYCLSPAAIGQRRLKNMCLSYLLSESRPQQEDIDRVVQQYRQAGNMTDVVAVLSAISHCDVPEREELLEEYYKKWRKEQLVMDKWLIIQAGSSLPSTLSEVKKLMEHPVFSMANPNKVRALIGSFGANHVVFHNSDGAGYRFLAEQIVSLNATNPQIASRLTTPFAAWKRYDSNRQALIKEQLQFILNQKDLSGDVYEMVRRSLDS